MSAQHSPPEPAPSPPAPGLQREWRPRRIDGPMLLRVLAVGTGIAVFISLFGPFHGGVAGFLVQHGPTFVYSWLGSLMGLTAVRVSWRLGLWARGPLVVGVASGLLMVLPMAVLVWLVQAAVIGHPLPASAALGILWDVLLVCLAATVLALLVSGRNAKVERAAGPPKFLERLPLKLRGGELWAVEAQDHYLRLHTAKGQDLILMRLADALEELDGIEGAQVHRSWWVAREAIVDARRGDGRATLTLKDGSEVPVSRTYARLLRERKWI